MARKPMVDTFDLASGRGAYDEYPVFPPGRLIEVVGCHDDDGPGAVLQTGGCPMEIGRAHV